ncbi:hypothetical protein DWG14_00230 [Streptomyces griseorubiginosus]|uniref:Uncharacterized protein n=1 Tax=Streptomyces griseorubiginosus TaxID=67304 RepID=A0AAI8PKL5_9ACTN|nr:hypothetical protein DWG14_00230 [Streptomyces griseorubiginosus]
MVDRRNCVRRVEAVEGAALVVRPVAQSIIAYAYAYAYSYCDTDAPTPRKTTSSPLQLGGVPRDPANLWPELYAGASWNQKG